MSGPAPRVLAFGDREGAVGWLVGEENCGLETMFIMMNAARFSVGLEGIGLSERPVAYVQQRTELGGASRDKVAIVQHADVCRMRWISRADL